MTMSGFVLVQLHGSLRNGMSLAQVDFGFAVSADNLFGGGPFSWYLTSIQSLILPLQTDQFLGVGQTRIEYLYSGVIPSFTNIVSSSTLI